MSGVYYVTVMVRPRDSGASFRPYRVLINRDDISHAEIERRAECRLTLQGYEVGRTIRLQYVNRGKKPGARECASNR